jgi:predicted TIM-barrel fold metal-dependent hydrolase
MRINDSHVHFFSPRVFETLGAQQGLPADRRGPDVLRQLAWDDPVSVEALADRWVAEFDRHGVQRGAIIASVPNDEASVAAALARHPSRFVGFFMLNPTQGDALERAGRALDAGLRGICLYPAMFQFNIQDPRSVAVFKLAASRPGTVVFVHCGVLSIGVRKKLGLPNPFDVRFGNPLDIHAVALQLPNLPIVVPHFGAGMLREALMLADLCSNVHLDTSSSNAWVRYTPGLTLDRVFRTAIDVIGPTRLIFGTDSSFFPRGWNKPVLEAQVAAMSAAGLSTVEQESIVAGNFDRLFPATL